MISVFYEAFFFYLLQFLASFHSMLDVSAELFGYFYTREFFALDNIE
jgi:hypothetical protein